MSTYKDKDDRTNIILDFIAGGVPGNMSGESCGLYDAIIGNAHSAIDLSKLTLMEIYAQQVAAHSRGMPSDAIGRYQFIGPTLHRLVVQAKLPLTTLFTNALQDQLALQLLRGRGYGAWFAGTLSDHLFAHNLSMEWASLPDPQNDGRSHYDGLAGNHASCSLSAVYAMLCAARDARPECPAPITTAPAPVLPASPERRIPPAINQQEWLRDAGFYKGEIDGRWGPLSQAALAAYYNRK